MKGGKLPHVPLGDKTLGDTLSRAPYLYTMDKCDGGGGESIALPLPTVLER